MSPDSPCTMFHPFAHRQVSGRPDIQSVHGKHQKHLGSPTTDAPQLRQLRHDGGVVGVRQRLMEVENPGMDGFGYSFDGLGLRTREAGCPEAFHAGG